MIQSRTTWQLERPDQKSVQELVATLKIPSIVAEMLVNRGLTNPTEAKRFLEVDKQAFYNPFLLSEMDKLVERVQLAIERNEQITVFGDYDADGVTSTVILLKALTKLGATKLDYYIPDRFEEGYGPNKQAIELLHKMGTKLIISCDTGISAVEEVELAEQLGMDFIITDHHQLGTSLPAAYAIVHPQHPNAHYPYQNLSGAGVAFKVSQALLGEIDDELLVLATIGTIADQVELLDENRLLVYRGIHCFQDTQSVGLLALARISGIELANLQEEVIAFAFAPRINAAGRLRHASLAVELLATNSQAEAEEKAKQLDTLNRERQMLVEQIIEEAILCVQPDDLVIVVAQEKWHQGVLGIVASRLVDSYNRPAIVLSIDSETGLAHGSARSVNGFDLFQNISTCKEMLEDFGGHPMAAGLTISAQNIKAFRKHLLKQASEQLAEKRPSQTTRIEADLMISDLSIPFIKQLNQFAPFGNGNPKPNFLLTAVQLPAVRRIGNDQTHLKATVAQNEHTVDMIGFGFGAYVGRITPYDQFSLVGQLGLNEWRGHISPQIFLMDLACEMTQIIDCRGKLVTVKTIDEIPEPRRLILFSEEQRSQFPEKIQQEAILFSEQLELPYEANIVLLDVPQDKSSFEKKFRGQPFAAFFLFLKKRTENLFNTAPTRVHFKEYYAFLTQNSAFDYRRLANHFEKRKGWKNGAISFMSEVFFELGFATIEDGFVSLNHSPAKRDLRESRRFQQMQDQLELENQLLLSSSKELYHYFRGGN